MEKLPYKECENCKDWNGNIANCMVICPKPIKALKELQQYRQIGTVDECREAMDRQVAKEPQFHISEFQCPNCGMENLEEIDDLGHIYLRHKYCPDCGQALKWGD